MIVTPITGFCNCSIFLLLYVNSCFAIIFMGKRERAGCFAYFVFLVSLDCCVATPLSAIGLSAICDCDTHYFWVSFMRTAMALASLHICLV